MKTLLATTLFAALATSTAFAQDPQPADATAAAPSDPCNSPCRVAPSQPAQVPAQVQAQPAAAQPVAAPVAVSAASPATSDDQPSDDDGWHRPAGKRFTSGFRLGGMYVSHYDAPTRMSSDGTMTSLKSELGLKSPYMFLLGYEGFYRIVGHSWLNVLMVGNISVAGLEQSKFIPTGSGLLGFEIQRSFEIGVGVNLTPDTQAPSHMIVAGGWTPTVGSIQTPIHIFYIPDADGNSRTGATIGMNW